jgi:hypothetical protein
MNGDLNSDNEADDSLDLATAQRLRRLSGLTMDVSRLQSAIERDIPRPSVSALPGRLLLFRRPVLALAASLVLLASMAGLLVITALPAPVLASPQVLTQLYQHTASEAVMTSPTGEVMPCCIQKVEGKKVTCVSLTIAGKRVMLATSDASHFRAPESAGRKTVNGTEYRYQSQGPLNMVMAIKNDSWLCLMGEAPIDAMIAQLDQMPTHP